MPNVLPSAVDSEIAFIGCAFIEPSVMFEARDIISPSDFYDIKNKIIYEAMLSLMDENKDIDVTTVTTRLTLNDKLQTAGGIEYLSEIAQRSYSSANYESYLDDIYNASMKRKAISVLGDLSQAGFQDVELDKYIDEVERQVMNLSSKRRVSSFRHIHSVTEEVEKIAEVNAKNDSTVIGLDTGFEGLNKLTQGFVEGQLIILAARPAMGKSAFALNLAMNIANLNDKNVAIFSLEMSNAELVQRMVAAQGSISLKYIKNGHLNKTDWIRFSTSLSKVGQMKIYFDDSNDTTLSSIRSKCRKLKSESGLGFIVIDYLQLIEYDDSGRMSQVEKVTKITRSLKIMARELEVPILCLSQLSRKVEERDDKKPVMSDLRDSGSIEQDADMVMLLYRDDYYNKGNSTRKGEADLIMGKNRSGSIGEIPFIFTGEYQKFREKTKEEENE
ncbi:MAG: replicative DNA helicase [Acholeplasmatales bacterium]|nr:replicative DNA helicase [Acholeplasmatales bacterium]